MASEQFLTHYESPDPKLWKGRPDGPRLYQHIQCVDLQKTPSLNAPSPAFAIIGFASDEGVKRNFGRLGAALGPNVLRRALAPLPLHGHPTAAFVDLGNVHCQDGDLEGAQAALEQIVATLSARQMTSIVLGGGHELAFAHFQGLVTAHPEKRIGVLNFDAHFDLRPLQDGLGTSGSPFFQMHLAEAARHKTLDYTCIGIQSVSNTTTLFESAKTLGVNVVQAGAIERGDLEPALKTIRELVARNDAIYVSLCLDVFAECFAPGVSAPCALGLFPQQITPLIEEVVHSKKVIAFDIAELSPAHDIGGMTARLAASMLHVFLEAWGTNRGG